MNEQELWHVIEEFPNYSVSSWGNVRNDVTGKVRKLEINSCNYLMIGFYDNKKQTKKKITRIFVHRLVATYFIYNPLNKEQVNHINGIKTDNYYKNLEWVTRSENMRHSYDVLKNNVGEDNGNSKITEFEVLIICEMIKTIPYTKIDELIGHPKSGIASTIGRGKIWKHVTKKLDYVPYSKYKK